jgi:two-component system, LytTR family, sensor kinase
VDSWLGCFVRAEALGTSSKLARTRLGPGKAEMSYSKSERAQFWTLQFVAWPAYGLVSFFGVLPYVGLGPHLDSVRSALFSKIAFTAIGLIASSGLGLFYRYESGRGSSWMRIAISAVASSYVAGACATFGANAARVLGRRTYIGGGWSGYLGGAVTASAVFLAWSACYFAIRSYQALESQKRTALRANALAHRAQLETLRSQINPHFLFNALNSIHALVIENPTRATTAIEELADFLRSSLTCIKAPDIPLCEEIETLERYLALEKIRFEEKLSATVNIDEKAGEVRVPGFLLHPILENAIKYGMQTSAMPLQIRLTAERLGTSLRVAIANTGHWASSVDDFQMKARTGLGLQIVKQRLEHLYPGRHQFSCAECDGWVENVIVIQLSESGAA